jgi:thioredoxin 1
MCLQGISYHDTGFLSTSGSVDGLEIKEMKVGFLDSLFGKRESGTLTAKAADPATPGSSAAGTASAAVPIHVTDETFEELVLNSSLPALVDFWAPWCGPCRMIAPIVEDLAQAYDGQALIAKLNTDENVQVAGQLGIMGIPTLILFKDGQEVDRVVGYAPRHVLEGKLNAALN